MDFGFRTVAFGRWGCGDGCAAIRLDGEVEEVLGVGCGRAEGGEDETGFEGFGGCEELVGEVLLGLREKERMLADGLMFDWGVCCVRCPACPCPYLSR